MDLRVQKEQLDFISFHYRMSVASSGLTYPHDSTHLPLPLAYRGFHPRALNFTRETAVEQQLAALAAQDCGTFCCRRKV